MSILVNENTRVIIQGATGKQGRFHTQRMLEYGVKVVGGVTPGKGGQAVHGVPIFNTVSEAKKKTHVNASMLMVPASGVLPATLESIENKIPLIVIITEFVPFHDMLVIRRSAQAEGVRVNTGLKLSARVGGDFSFDQRPVKPCTAVRGWAAAKTNARQHGFQHE